MLLGLLLLAQSSAAVAPPVVVTGSRLPPLTAPITLDANRLDGAGSLAQALAGVPQLFIAQPGGRSGFAAPTLDGADPNFTLVLFDGVPINNATSSRGGAVNLAEIGSIGLAGISLLPANLSAVHGSGALAGVIALTPAEPGERLVAIVQAGGITRGGLSAGALVSGPLGGGWGASLSGQIDDDGTPTPQAHFVARTALLRLSRDGGADRLLLRLNDISARGFPDASGGAMRAVRRGVDVRGAREWLAAVRTRQALADGVTLDLNASWLGRDERLTSPGVAGAAANPFGLPASRDATRYDRFLGQASLAATLAGVRLAAGIEGSHERGRSQGALDFGAFAVPTAYRLERGAWAGFAEAAASSGSLSATGAVRVDRIGALKARLSGRLAGAVALGGGWRVEASAGSSFKAPSFYALANPLVGNPALRPESGHRADVALAWGDDRSRLRLSAFASGYRDLIDFVFQPAPRLINRGAVAVEGVAASAHHQAGPISLDLAVQHLWPRDAAGGPALLLRPRWRANAALNWAVDRRLSLGLNAGHVGARDDESLPTGRQRLSPYVAVAADARWQASDAVQIRLAADNLLDSDWQDAVGFPAPPLRLRLLASARF